MAKKIKDHRRASRKLKEQLRDSPFGALGWQDPSRRTSKGVILTLTEDLDSEDEFDEDFYGDFYEDDFVEDDDRRPLRFN